MATPIPDNHARFAPPAVAQATRGTLVQRPNQDSVAEGVTTDSRAVRPGSVFVALRGDVHDAHAFLPAAVERGARILVVERGRTPTSVPPEIAIVEVDDTLVAWGDLARAHLEAWRTADPRRRVVAITGSAGKTTTKELTAALLGAVAPTHFTAGNLNNRIGVPAVVFGLEEHHRFAVLEMGMSLVGELDRIAGFARPDVGVIVNVGVAHAEGVGGREGVMREKGAVYRALDRQRGIAVINADDPFVVRAAADTKPPLGGPRLHFGMADDADYRLVRRESVAAGSRLSISRPSGALTVELPLSGEAAAIDLLAALAAAEAAAGQPVDADRIARALAMVRLEGRGTVLRFANGLTVIDDTYNANPASMRAALATLVEIAPPGSRRIAVLGEMKELGALGDEEHVRLGDAVADAKVALLVGCGGALRLTAEQAEARGVVTLDRATVEEATAATLAEVRRGDVVLVKGSRSVGAEMVVRALEKLNLP